MMLVPTLQKMVAYTVAADFWDNHQKCQEGLDAQCEDRETGTFLGEWDRRSVLRVARIDLSKMTPEVK